MPSVWNGDPEDGGKPVEATPYADCKPTMRAIARRFNKERDQEKFVALFAFLLHYHSFMTWDAIGEAFTDKTAQDASSWARHLVDKYRDEIVAAIQAEDDTVAARLGCSEALVGSRADGERENSQAHPRVPGCPMARREKTAESLIEQYRAKQSRPATTTVV